MSGAKTSEIYRGVTLAVLVVAFFSGKNCCGCLLSKSLVTSHSCCVTDIGSPSLFLVISIHLSFASLWEG